jgi:hypothetical protein
VVLTGAGRAFCAGGSIDDFDLFRTDLAARANAMRSARRLIDEMLNVRVPVVAALNGPAVGLRPSDTERVFGSPPEAGVNLGRFRVRSALFLWLFERS